MSGALLLGTKQRAEEGSSGQFVSELASTVLTQAPEILDTVGEKKRAIQLIFTNKKANK